jgi:thioesterase domain-containing protein
MTSFETAAVIADRYRPAVFDGDLYFFTAGKDHADHEALARSWRPYASGEIHNRVVDVRHLELSHPAALTVVGEVIERAVAQC